MARARSPAYKGACAPQKNKKMSCHAYGNCYKERNSSSLGEHMRRFMRFPPRTVRFRSLLVLAGAFGLLVAFTPRVNADLLRYYNMEGLTPTPPYDVNLDSHLPAVEVGAGTTLFMDNGTPNVPFPGIRNIPAPGLSANLVPGDPAANLNSFGVIRSGQSNLGVQIPMPSQFGIYNVTSVSFGYANNGNGYSAVQLQFSTNGGATFTNIGGVVALPQTGSNGSPINIAIPSGTTMGDSNLVLRLLFTGGQSNGWYRSPDFSNSIISR